MIDHKLSERFRLLHGVSASGIALFFLLLAGCTQRQEESKVSTPEEPRQLIIPGTSVGNVKLGMSARQVMEEIGEPQRRTSNAMEYTQYGFAVMPDAEGLVRVVMCGDVTGHHGPLVKKFTARTVEGVGMGSTRDDVLRAFGQPTVEETHVGGRRSLEYKNLGMAFSIEDGTVHHIIVRLGEEYRAAAVMGVDAGQVGGTNPVGAK